MVLERAQCHRVDFGLESQDHADRITQLGDGTKLDKPDQLIKRLHEEAELEVADFLMVGLDSEEAENEVSNEELLEATSAEIDAIMEDSTT